MDRAKTTPNPRHASTYDGEAKERERVREVARRRDQDNDSVDYESISEGGGEGRDEDVPRAHLAGDDEESEEDDDSDSTEGREHETETVISSRTFVDSVTGDEGVEGDGNETSALEDVSESGALVHGDGGEDADAVDGDEDSFDSAEWLAKELKLKKIYEENIDSAIAEMEHGNFFLGYDKIPDPDKYLTRKKVLKKKKLELSEYSESDFQDLFALGYNTIKTEILDLYKIVSSMESRGMLVPKETISQFYDWWNQFVTVLILVLDVEEEVIHPFIEARVDLSGTGVSRRERAEFRQRLASLLEIIRVQEEKNGYIPAGEVTPKTLAVLNVFIPLLRAHMADTLNNAVPKLNECIAAVEIRKGLVPLVIRYYREREEWTHLAALMASWMDRKQARHFKRELLSKGERLRFSLWARHLERNHHEIREAIIAERRVRQTLYKSLSG